VIVFGAEHFNLGDSVAVAARTMGVKLTDFRMLKMDGNLTDAAV